MATKQKKADVSAPATSEASDYVGDLKYRDATDDEKPGPLSVVSVQVLPEDEE